jgi:hypothetical protein
MRKIRAERRNYGKMLEKMPKKCLKKHPPGAGPVEKCVKNTTRAPELWKNA